jgi:hypothetical protein
MKVSRYRPTGRRQRRPCYLLPSKVAFMGSNLHLFVTKAHCYQRYLLSSSPIPRLTATTRNLIHVLLLQTTFPSVLHTSPVVLASGQPLVDCVCLPWFSVLVSATTSSCRGDASTRVWSSRAHRTAGFRITFPICVMRLNSRPRTRLTITRHPFVRYRAVGSSYPGAISFILDIAISAEVVASARHGAYARDTQATACPGMV